MSQVAATVEFVYDFVSVPCHIAWKSLGPMVEAIGAKVVMTPVLCGGIFKATGNTGPLGVPAKRDWYERDLALWARRRRVTLVQSPFLPVRSLHLMRGSVVAAEHDETSRYVDAIFDSIYVHGRNLSDMRLFAETLTEAGLDADAYLHGIERPEVKQRLLSNTEKAVARHVFGVPTFFVGGELFFGQDRLEFVVEALQLT
ncbi:MAG: 2-hydroxychromene-2-carboxylate isomerase [Caldimonas sp.]